MIILFIFKLENVTTSFCLERLAPLWIISVIVLPNFLHIFWNKQTIQTNQQKFLKSLCNEKSSKYTVNIRKTHVLSPGNLEKLNSKFSCFTCIELFQFSRKVFPWKHVSHHGSQSRLTKRHNKSKIYRGHVSNRKKLKFHIIFHWLLSFSVNSLFSGPFRLRERVPWSRGCH